MRAAAGLHPRVFVNRVRELEALEHWWGELRRYLDDRQPDTLVSSTLLVIESRRGVLRNRSTRMLAVDASLAVVTLLDLSDAVVESAGRLPDPTLRSLEAIHLATALLIRENVDVLLSYDDRLTAAAAAHGLCTATPA